MKSIIKQYRKVILKELVSNKGMPNKHSSKNYGGNSDTSLHISISVIRQLVRKKQPTKS